MQKEIVFAQMDINAGGITRDTINLSNALVERGYKVYIIPTQMSKEALDPQFTSDLKKDISIYYLKNDHISYNKLRPKLIAFFAKLEIRFAELFAKQGSEKALIRKRYGEKLYRKVQLLIRFLKQHPSATVVAFGNHSIWLALLAKKKGGLKNKLIISERTDPNSESVGKLYSAFINQLFESADLMLFQTSDAMQWYQKRISISGKVIFNPLRPDLPEPYAGRRKKIVVNYCRLHPQKNLFLLVEAFERLYSDHPDFQLHIYADDPGLTPEYSRRFIDAVKNSRCASAIHVFPARADVLSVVKDSFMFVSSSDYEGMPNSMLEALAIGLPTVCTDCPIGGARTVIKDHENGILTPVGDAAALYRAMKEVIEVPGLAEKLSANGRQIRQLLSIDNIVNQWIDAIENC